MWYAYDMRTEQEIREKLKKVMDDERLHYPPADVFINAPLALIQTHLEAQRGLLTWILNECGE